MRTLFLLAAMAIPIASHAAASLEIWPVTISVTGNEQNGIVWLRNIADTSVSLQIRVMDWKQVNSKNIYAEQNNIIANPPFVVMPAHKKIPIRIFGIDNTGATEKTYKVVIDELPTPADLNTSPGNNIKIRMQYVLPLFAYGKTMPAEVLPGADGVPKEKHPVVWSIKNHQLAIENQGSTHIKITSLNFQCAKRSSFHQSTPVSYVLAHSTMTLPLTLNPAVPLTNCTLALLPSR